MNLKEFIGKEDKFFKCGLVWEQILNTKRFDICIKIPIYTFTKMLFLWKYIAFKFLSNFVMNFLDNVTVLKRNHLSSMYKIVYYWQTVYFTTYYHFIGKITYLGGLEPTFTPCAQSEYCSACFFLHPLRLLFCLFDFFCSLEYFLLFFRGFNLWFCGAYGSIVFLRLLTII